GTVDEVADLLEVRSEGDVRLDLRQDVEEMVLVTAKDRVVDDDVGGRNDLTGVHDGTNQLGDLAVELEALLDINKGVEVDVKSTVGRSQGQGGDGEISQR